MPSTSLNTTNFGTGQSRRPSARVRVRSSGVENEPAFLILDSVNAAGTVATRHVWFDSAGNIRASSSNPSDPDTSGTNLSEKNIIFTVGTLAGGSDIAGRPAFTIEGAAGQTFSLIRGAVLGTGNFRVPSGQSLIFGLTSPAGTVVNTTRTSTLASGTRLALGSFSNTSLNTGQVVRVNVTSSASATMGGGLIVSVTYRER